MSEPFEIPADELSFRASRSSGAGGQHVNKTSSRVEVIWNLRDSRALTPEQRDRVLSRLASRVSADGTVRVAASTTRSQYRNRELATTRLTELVRRALAVRRTRVPTRPTEAARQARLEAKRRRSEKKQRRQRTDDDD